MLALGNFFKLPRFLAAGITLAVKGVLPLGIVLIIKSLYQPPGLARRPVRP
jgi:hypothetical protein